MARDVDNQIDMTFLSLKLATKRGFLHRDFVAHCLRWTHVLRHLKPTKPTRILELGCGVEAPLAKTLYSSRHTMHQYLGVDYGPIKPEIEFNGHFQPQFLERQDISTLDRDVIEKALGGPPQLIVSFEVAEHMEPDRWATSIMRMVQFADPEATFLLSTPVYDEGVGPADNHINEWKYESFLYTMYACGLDFVNNWGTFASQKDYKKFVMERYGFSGQEIFNTFSEYFDSNMLACVMAPLFPRESRNVLWEFEVADAMTREGGEHLSALVESVESTQDLGQCESKEAWCRLLEVVGVKVPDWLSA